MGSTIDEEEAKRLAHGVQQERLSKVLLLTKELNQYSLALMANDGDIEDFRDKLKTARDTLLDMLLHKDKRGADQQKLVKETADAVSEQIDRIMVPVGKEAQLKQLIETWNVFKETREKELVPAILNGKEDEARSIAYGVQNKRLMKCLALAGNLDH